LGQAISGKDILPHDAAWLAKNRAQIFKQNEKRVAQLILQLFFAYISW